MARHYIIGRAIVFVVNFVLWACGIVLIVFGSIALADPDIIVDMLNHIDGVSYITTLMDVADLFFGTAIFMIVLGCFLFLLGGNGCHGVMKKSKKSIMVFWILLICAILTEIALIIYAAVYPGTEEDWMKQELNTSLVEHFEPVTIDDDDWTIDYANEETNPEAYSWQKLQFETKCCGAYDWRDYTKFEWDREYDFPNSTTTINSTFVPLSCCITTTPKGEAPSSVDQIPDYEACLTAKEEDVETYIYTKACWTTVDDMVWNFNLISIIIASCLIGVELIGLIFAVFLWTRDDDD